MAIKKYQQISPETQEESMKVAKATQRPGQTKEQTKLIAQGIEKGIAHYKKQQKEKSRTLNKKLQKVSQQLTSSSEESSEVITGDKIIYKQSLLPWVLLVMSWVAFLSIFVLDLKL